MRLYGQSLQGVPGNASRFLLRFSYLGTRYSGIQRQAAREPNTVEKPTVQYALESAINSSFRLKYPAVLSLSSRTDAGVHAVLNTAHVDLLGNTDDFTVSEENLVYYVNKYMLRNRHDVVLREAIRVPYWFHARFCAQRRTYIYRIAVPKEGRSKFKRFVPLEELNHCYIVPGPVDIEIMQKACKFFEGFHNFASFRNTQNVNQPPEKNISEFSLVPEHVVKRQYMEADLAESFSWWRFTISGRSFLYRQVRRMVGSVLAVGLGKIPLEEVSYNSSRTATY
ncbi:tRNA pseudouridine synthase 1-like [Tropilaelaps mercedesae]|uniref:tRNA pseudouridine synthase n=1 Tax=Tropilaelaps mercedesae TaxID=418985 RepID=A0A1V9XU67_9ACAR|nr:tRNA pseudouridine synthase 1-like [Tropilaelaps mercedesae]